MPIIDRPLLYPRKGTISMGYMTNVRKDGSHTDKPFPAKAKTFVFHSDDQAQVVYVARAFGGRVEESLSRTDEGGRWHVVTEVTSFDAVLPSVDSRGFEAWYEHWRTVRGGLKELVRRCNGKVCVFAIDEETGEIVRDVPCICDAKNLEGDHACDAVTRMNVLVPALNDAPDVGVWQIQSGGMATFQALAPKIALVAGAASEIIDDDGKVVRVPPTMVPIIVKMDTTSARGVEDGKAVTRSVPVTTFSLRASMNQLLESKSRSRLPMLPMTPDPDMTQPPLGVGMPPEQRAAADEEQEPHREPPTGVDAHRGAAAVIAETFRDGSNVPPSPPPPPPPHMDPDAVAIPPGGNGDPTCVEDVFDAGKLLGFEEWSVKGIARGLFHTDFETLGPEEWKRLVARLREIAQTRENV